MTKQQLETLEDLLTKFYNDDIFGMGEMNELEQIKQVVELVRGAIISYEE